VRADRLAQIITFHRNDLEGGCSRMWPGAATFPYAHAARPASRQVDFLWCAASRQARRDESGLRFTGAGFQGSMRKTGGAALVDMARRIEAQKTLGSQRRV